MLRHLNLLPYSPRSSLALLRRVILLHNPTHINASGHPFFIKTVNSAGTANAFNTGVTGNGTDVGTLTFVVPLNAPASLHYNCEFHSSMNGSINVADPVPVENATWGKIKHRYLR